LVLEYVLHEGSIMNRAPAAGLLPLVGDHVILRGTRIVGDVARVEGNGGQGRVSVKVTEVLGKSSTSKAARAWRGAWLTCQPTMVATF
jgi:hypothetical protein